MQVYADNAATTKMSKVAINAMMEYLENNYGKIGRASCRERV